MADMLVKLYDVQEKRELYESAGSGRFSGLPVYRGK